MTVPQTIKNDPKEVIKRFAELRTSGLPGIGVAWVVMHYEVALSCP